MTADDWYNLVFIIDEGTQGDGTSNFTIYVDDITQVSSSTSSVISDFEVDGSISGFDGGAQEDIDNPDTSGNSSDKVLKLVKNCLQVYGYMSSTALYNLYPFCQINVYKNLFYKY